jgi:FkbM family methyltransferase
MIGRRRYQRFFQGLHGLALQGMNIGGGTHVGKSGEALVINTILPSLVGDRPVVFDVGANVGTYSEAILRAFGSRVHLHAFEPSASAFALLEAAVGSHENVRLHQVGLGVRDERLTLYSNEPASGLASVYPRRLDHFGIALNEREEIRLRPLDDVCAEEGIEHIDLLKLDVEGNEFHVLQGAERMLAAGAIELIQFEFGGCNIDSRTYLQDFFYLLGPRYRIHRIVRDGLFPLDSYREADEVFITTNFLAMRRR